MNAEDLKSRTKQFALRVMTLTEALPSNMKGEIIGKQILRSSTSVGANYRAAQRARSKKEFVAKLGIVLEEADETAYWLELIEEGNLLSPARLQPLKQEANELCAIIFTTIRNTQANDKS
ncbi:MAG: four helix bundle protein [Verrucomicrobiota bacterium]